MSIRWEKTRSWVAGGMGKVCGDREEHGRAKREADHGDGEAGGRAFKEVDDYSNERLNRLYLAGDRSCEMSTYRKYVLL